MKKFEWSVIAVRVLDPGNKVIFLTKKEWSPRFVKHRQLTSSAKSTQNRKKLFFFV